jgi:hypothetical protein
MPIRLMRVLVAALLVVALTGRASADKIDDLTRALMQDSSYKVRVQAALVLGKLGDKRAVPALIQGLRDENETVRGVAATSLGRLGDKSSAAALMAASTNDASDFVRAQAKKALELVANGGGITAITSAPNPGARFYVAIDFSAAAKVGPEWSRLMKEGLSRELQKLPTVTLAVTGSGSPSQSLLASRHLTGFILDGNIQKLSASPGGGQMQIDCDVKAFVATYPDKAIRMMTTEGASLQTGMSQSDQTGGKRDCLNAAIEAIRDDVAKFLATQR